MYYMACVGIKFLCSALKKTVFFQYDIHLFCAFQLLVYLNKVPVMIQITDAEL